jgi:DNA-directed RNA polymerase subunit RPC12/RpoP
LEARARVIAAFMGSPDRVIPADESVPLKGATFRDWEGQAAAVRRAVIPTLLEGRAAVEGNASAESGGRCPHCGSERVYLERQETSPEVLSPDGPVVFPRQ